MAAPLGRKEGVIPGAHLAHPYQFYRVAQGGRHNKEEEGNDGYAGNL